MSNQILDELHAAREKLLTDAGGDLHRYVEEARLRALRSGRVIAEPTQRAKRNAKAVESGHLTVAPTSVPSDKR